ncbi:hypothetical protein MUK42_10490, partial [Musa troglodytarum]
HNLANVKKAIRASDINTLHSRINAATVGSINQHKLSNHAACCGISATIDYNFGTSLHSMEHLLSPRAARILLPEGHKRPRNPIRSGSCSPSSSSSSVLLISFS